MMKRLNERAVGYWFVARIVSFRCMYNLQSCEIRVADEKKSEGTVTSRG